MEIVLRREKRRRAYTAPYAWKALAVSVVLLRMARSMEMEVDVDSMGAYFSNSIEVYQPNGVEQREQREQREQSNPMATQPDRREGDRKRQSQSTYGLPTKQARLNKEEGPQGHTISDSDNIRMNRSLIVQAFLNYFNIAFHDSDDSHTLDGQDLYNRVEYAQPSGFFSVNLEGYSIITNSKVFASPNIWNSVLEELLGRVRVIDCQYMHISLAMPSSLIRLLIARTVVKDLLCIRYLDLKDISLNPQSSPSEGALGLSALRPIQISIRNCSHNTAVGILSWISIRFVQKLLISNCQLCSFDLKRIRFTDRFWVDIYQNVVPFYSIAFQKIHKHQQVFMSLFGSSQLKEITVEEGSTVSLDELLTDQGIFIGLAESYKEAKPNDSPTKKNLMIGRLEVHNATQTRKEMEGLCFGGLQVAHIQPIPNYSAGQRARHQSNKDFKSLQSALRNTPGIC
ncbi:hypothetical protein NEFER03_2244 [Nematocida sp. LUAm3]|nr:hypothetical protein NEFER03_2244 [Nematocida sp. LUAm3]